MRSRGFSLIELLVALAVCALLSGAMAAVAPPARALFDATPEVLDLQQRERTAVDVLAQAIRSAAVIRATNPDGTPGAAAPAVALLRAGSASTPCRWSRSPGSDAGCWRSIRPRLRAR
jgi:prepilin-type N-terminal cleavage/methylation domain-containing protein